MNNEVTRLNGIDNEKYWTRVDRSLCWLGETDSEQKARQEILASKTVGVAGCGGIGGALALRLARLGIKHIKVADPDQFDWTNINRQLGASKDTVGQNKAEVVGHMVHELSGGQDKVVSTLGLELGQACRTFGAERYFCLSPRMKEFITDHRLQMGELGRFSSLFHQGARAVFQAAIGYAYENKIEYFIAWANPQVIDHMRNVLGIPFWALEVPINAKAVESDDQWVCPPRNFFFRDPPPRLLLSVVPFWELVHRHLSIETSLKENI